MRPLRPTEAGLRTLLFRITDNALYVANHGRRFDRRGVISVCRENLSAKAPRGFGQTLDDVSDRKLVDAIRERRLEVYRIDRDQLQEDANHEDETSRDYAGRSLWELLQNADDALAPSGTSSADLIGAKGLGFKSVLEISDRPSIHSGPFDFGFDAEISKVALEAIQADAPRLTFRLPHRIERDKEAAGLIRAGYATVIRLPFRLKGRDSILARLESLDPHFLLLCRHIDTVLVEQHGQQTMRLSVARQRGATLRNSPAMLSIMRRDVVVSSEWRIWSALATAPSEHSKSLSAAIAVPIHDGIAGPAAAEIPVHVFFPTTETIAARFLVHGSFALTSNRNSIRADNYDPLVREQLQGLVLQVIRDIPATSAVRLFADIVRATKSGRVKRPDRLIQQAIARAVTEADFIPVLGGGKVKPAECRVWEHEFDRIVPSKLARENRLAVPALTPVFGELRSPFDAQPLRPVDYAEILGRTKALSLDAAVQALRIVYSACLASTQQNAVMQTLAHAQIWPTAEGTFRALNQAPGLLRHRPEEWPTWLPADTLHLDAEELLNGYDSAATARWAPLLTGRLLQSADDWLKRSLVAMLKAWGDEDWEAHGFETLGLIEKWVKVPEFGLQEAFVERFEDTSVRYALVSVVRVPTKDGWVPAVKAYANRDLGAPPELAAYFKGVSDRYVVGMPRQATVLFGLKRWKALLRFLGVAWEPKIQLVPRNGSLRMDPAYSRFWQSLTDRGLNYINQEWYIEHFPAALEGLGPSHVATCMMTLSTAAAALFARWRKTNSADRTHAPSPFTSFANYQMRQERYLPQRPFGGRRGDRLAPHELFWPGKGVPGITPILDVGTTNALRRAASKATFVDRLGVRSSLPTDWATWCAWSDKVLADIEAGEIPSPKSVRDFYDALLRTASRPNGTSKITRVAAIRPGQQDEVVVEKSANTLWIDKGRFENQEVLNGLGLLGKAILPVRLERGIGAVQALGVRPASELLEVEPSYESAPERRTKFMESRVASRRGALAAICATKAQPLKSIPRLIAVQDLRLRISIEGQLLADRSSASYNNGTEWLISLQAPDQWEAVAAALAEGFGGHAADLKYRFAKVLKARRDEIAAILADDGIPGYRIKEAMYDFEEAGDEEDDTEGGAETNVPQSSPDDESEGDGAQGLDSFDDEEDESEDGTSEEDASSVDDGLNKRGDLGNDNARRSGGGRPKGHLTRKKLFGGGRNQDEQARRTGREAAEVAKAVAARGMRAEAWLMQQIVHNLDTSWLCMANVRDDRLRETDVLLSRAGEEWHIEVKSLTAERLYWSELEREKAERHADRYFMALLVENSDRSYSVRWSWDPLRDLALLERRVEWLWDAATEGPSLRDGWRMEAGVRWPERRADRFVHVVRVTQEDLNDLEEDDPSLDRLRRRIGDSTRDGV
ncbi:MAG: hypothetical protein EOS41_23530 [Mesorhizobium sp.]|uniref:hypothetical protein n=1 Tax=Mesorhizobium sp. TaxID=1871066 RepID=UPI000FE74BA9|nr:hypothetical protein [Mesorhizobium sp.]RWE22857.1 MAG: hypothetical protein EOS41_23530 [Mesorhizobium sp.]